MILAVGVAAGQILGGLLVTADLVAAPWRPALLVNVAIGVPLLVVARRALAPMPPSGAQPLDLTGAGLLAVAMLGFVVPLSFGRESGWPVWTWPSLALCAFAGSLFVAPERRLDRLGGEPLLDLALVRMPRVASGAFAVFLVMACYAGFLVSVTLYLQESLGFTPLHAGATFAIYAGGFAAASLTWTPARSATRARLPIVGPIIMGAALLGIGLSADRHGWSAALTTPLLFAAGIGHAWAFSPLADRHAATVRPPQAAQLSGLILTASVVGKVVGVAGFVGIYLSAGAPSPAHGLAVTTLVLSLVLALCAASAARATVARKSKPSLAGV